MKKGILFVILSIGIAFLGVYLMQIDLMGYAILCYTVAGVLLLAGISNIIKNSNPTKVYESTVRDILNTFDSILVKSNNVPKLENRNVIMVESMDDLVDAQLELRKPICYLKQTESCSFVLLDDKEAYIYIEKLNDDVISPVEIEIKENKIKSKSAEEMDSEMLRDIDKTTIVKLSNKKSYKVSPVRKKKQEQVEQLVLEDEEINENKKSGSDDIEVLDF